MILNFFLITLKIEEYKINDPPCPIPHSIITSGFCLYMSSCNTTISEGYCIIGTPSQLKLYRYFDSNK